MPARVSRSLHETLGDEAAEYIVTWMQHVDTGRVELRELNDLSYGRIESRFDAQKHWLEAQMAEFRRAIEGQLTTFRDDMRTQTTEMREEMTAFREEVRAESARLELKIDQRFAELIKWSFVFWVSSVLSIAALARVLR